MTIQIRPFEDRDWPDVVRLKSEAFRSAISVEVGPRWYDTYRAEMQMLEDDAGRIIGCWRYMSTGQFFGGVSIPSMAVKDIVIAPEVRSRGLGRALIESMLAHGRANGMVLSVLHPSSVTFYRRFGYELAVPQTRNRTVLAALPPGDRSAHWEPMTNENFPEIMACYAAFAARQNGLIDRSPTWWDDHVLEPRFDPPPVYGYCCRHAGEVTGYLLYTQQASQGFGFTLKCRDLVWTDERAAQALFSFLHGQRAIAEAVSWFGAADDPLHYLAPENSIMVDHRDYYALRLVDPLKALESRGYPAGACAGLSLRIVDPQLAEPLSLRLEVEGGRGRVEPVSTASLTVDVGTLAALYGGALDASDAARAGRLADASEADIQALNLIFSGQPAWIMDDF